ncbi:MAG: hypothetical protein HOC91_13810 [Nitrospinaceae bacterium]|jgi:hypothetical protein|nr:hypothetical protein [Nitrospinaceae bacterium]MBT3433204.1 hypothetical protein [Nitrospinaceae bacterium]MBT3823225.1 hypothetical protein [Nitrospinaceae bacterium]MBT4093913.1 hypothetical protein [Nitrospinaceae bacterium]MBT4431580.1 hypothetical protein [Nitrospinaceae bacterium]
MEKPVDPRKESSVVGERSIDKLELPTAGYVFTMSADTETIEGEGQLKIGKHRHFEVFCDEPERIGGEDAYPQPLCYIAMGVGF